MLKSGESVGYNRKGIATRDIQDRYRSDWVMPMDIPRRLGNGVGKVWINTGSTGRRRDLAPLIGSVCMDMIMIDITGIPGVEEGDEVIIFGPELSLEKLAGLGRYHPL